MKKVVLSIAASLDGFIARPDGSLDWLPQPVPGGEDYGFADFIDNVDVLVMGRATYEQVLGMGAWPHPGKRCVVFSEHLRTASEDSVEIVRGDVAACVRELREEPGDGFVWIVGGAEIVAACLGGDVIDEIVLTTVPVMLGEGIRLFPERPWTTQLRLVDAKAFADGLVQHSYAVVPTLARWTSQTDDGESAMARVRVPVEAGCLSA